MTVIQHNKNKVRPFMDYSELNEHIVEFITNANVCTTNGAEKAQMYRF